MQNRAQITENEGMLFVFNYDGRHSFWMKNTLIALDMIWIDRNNKVVTIVKQAGPCLSERCPVFKPEKKARYVLEIGGGLSDKLGITVGDDVVMRIIDK